MSLRVWLPLTGDLRNNGLSDVTVTNNGATVDNSGKIGKCYYLSGSPNFINTGYSTNIGTNDFSIALWIKIPTITTGTYYAICSSKTAGSASVGFGIYWNYSQKKFLWSTADGSGATEIWMATAVDSIVYDKWIHLVMIRNNSDPKKGYFYINGVRYELASVPAIRNIATAPYTLALGKCWSNRYYLKAYYNDFRIYDHALSSKEVKLLSQGLVCHYKLSNAFSINNLMRNASYVPYNNYSSSGHTCTVIKTGAVYDGCDIYRMTYTPTATNLSNVQTVVYNHGIYGFRSTFKANTKYCFWILWKPISHPDTVVGGIASNIGGWTEVPTKKYSEEWNIVGQYRNGSVTADKTDNIFTSFKCPSATSGTPIIIDFCCPHLVEGYDYILAENEYQVNNENIVYDSSGYNNHCNVITSGLITNPDSPRNNLSTYFNGTAQVSRDSISAETRTISFWLKTTKTNQVCCFADYKSRLGFGFKSDGTIVTTCASFNIKTYSPSAITDNVWHHIGIVKKADDSDVLLYVDGILQSTRSGADSWTHTTDVFTLTGRSYGSPAKMTCYLSDFRLYATALSQEDIQQLYNTPVSVANTGAMLTQGEFVEGRR